MLPSGDKKLLLKSKLFSVLDICHKLRYTKPIIKLLEIITKYLKGYFAIIDVNSNSVSLDLSS